MRPILTLKKKPSSVPPSSPETVVELVPPPRAEPVAPPEPVNAEQPAKLSPQEAKQARLAANRLVNEELRAAFVGRCAGHGQGYARAAGFLDQSATSGRGPFGSDPFASAAI